MDPVESRIADGLTRLADDLPPSDDAWAAQLRRQARARTGRRRLAPIAVAAGVVVVAAGMAPVMAGDADPQPLPFFEPGNRSKGNSLDTQVPTSKPPEKDSDTRRPKEATRRAHARDAAQRAEEDPSYIPCFTKHGYLAWSVYLDAKPREKPMSVKARDEWCKTHDLRGVTKYYEGD